MAHLAVNIDHIATLREARYPREAGKAGSMAEPDPVFAAAQAAIGGADAITVHLREDRRHIQDRDVEFLREVSRVRFNLEMAATDEMIAIACRLRPHAAMLVPEGRHEITTEGGLDVVAGAERLAECIKRLHDAGVMVSAFIDAEARQVEAAAKIGCDVCEVHTGPFAHAFARAGGDMRRPELAEAVQHVRKTGLAIASAGMRFNAGHALNYHNVGLIASMNDVEELHVGHAIISRAVFVGLREAVRQMKDLIS